jgi:hypothetical protein
MAVRLWSRIVYKILPPTSEKSRIELTRALAAFKVSKDPKEVLEAAAILERSGSTRAINALGKYNYRISYAQRQIREQKEAATERDLLTNISNTDPYVVLTCLKGFLQHCPATEYPYSKMLENAIGSLSPDRKAAVLEENATAHVFPPGELISTLKLDDLDKFVEIFKATPIEKRRSIYANNAVYRNVLSWLDNKVCPGLQFIFSNERSPHEEKIANLAPLINFVFQHGHAFAERISCVKVLEKLMRQVPLVLTIFRAGAFPRKLVAKIDDDALIRLGMLGIDYFAEMASRDPGRVFQTVKRLLETCHKYALQDYATEREGKAKIISQVVPKFNDEMIWILITDFYAESRLCAEVLAGIGTHRAVESISDMRGQQWIDKLWRLLSTEVQNILRSRGFAPSGAKGERQESDNRQRQQGPRAEERKQGRQYDNRQRQQDYQDRARAGKPDPWRVLIDDFGFDPNWTYDQAKKHYFDLAMGLHPDYKQKKGMTVIRGIDEEKIKELNPAWNAAKDKFRKS